MSRSLRLTALAATLAATFSAVASDENAIVVTATRFAEPAENKSANVSVVSRREIAESPATNVPDLLRTLPGIDTRTLYGPMGIDATVDIRGSGETAISNTLVLIDGHRINAVDLSGIRWSSLPLEAVERIEVIRGSGTVLYGDRASGGVINVITDRSGKPRAGARVEAGSFGYRAVDAHLGGSNGAWIGNLSISDAQTDGYRQNSDAEQQSISASGGFRADDFDISVAASAFDQALGLPSQLTQAEYDTNPRLASTPNWRVNREGYRVQPSVGVQFGDDIRFEVDLSRQDETSRSRNPDWFMDNLRRTEAVSSAPRVRVTHGLGNGIGSETVAGFDYYRGEFAAHDVNSPLTQSAAQRNLGFFAQNTTTWGQAFDTTAGLRRQRFEQNVADQSSALAEERTDFINAWEIGAGYRPADALRMYVKTAKNFRLPNADELFAFLPPTFASAFNGTLRPQTGRLVEFGVIQRSGISRNQLALFRQTNTDEIGFIAANGRNANLDPTRRQGIEWEGALSVSDSIAVRATLTRVSARFTEGAFAGKFIPLVPRGKESAGITWRSGVLGTHSLNVVHTSSRYFGGDFANTRTQLAGFTTADYQVEWKLQPLTLGLRVMNLTDRNYSASGFSGTYYPADPRTIYVSAKAEFF